jgi:alanine dehydrogenase
MPANVTTLKSNQQNIEEALKEVDLLISAVLIPGAKTPHLVTRDMLGLMKEGSVLVDVAVDQGGAIETCKPTTHEDPVYVVDGVVHYCVANMPGAVPTTSTTALNSVTLPYVIQLADKGWWQATSDDHALKQGLNIVHGNITYQAVSDAFDLPYREVNEVLALHE